MTSIIVFESDEGPIPFEAPDLSRAKGVAPASGLVGLAGTLVSTERLEDALAVVGRAATSLQSALAGLRFSKAEATISLKLSAEGSFIIAKTAAEASLSITIALDKPQAP